MSALRELTIAKLIQACGRVEGRVKLQKVVYLLAAMGYGLPYRDFRIQYYGPFAPKLAAALDFLVRAGVIEETKADVGSDLPRYDYAVSEQWVRLLGDCVRIEVPTGRPNFDDVAKRLIQTDRSTLEIAATICFLHNEEGYSEGQLMREVKDLKGHLQPFDTKLQEARQLLGELNLHVA